MDPNEVERLWLEWAQTFVSEGDLDTALECLAIGAYQVAQNGGTLQPRAIVRPRVPCLAA